ncbi:MAG: DUF4091 domain-containing protein [Kiritimatiellae bacterium]|nr:DUF4091 domain-containing protein [Kiritimatiellia bacterium]
MKSGLSFICLVMSLTALADPFSVTLWRGERRVTHIPDYTELGEDPAGITVRRGVLKGVKYRSHPYYLGIAETYDRVEWDTEIGGPRLAEIYVPAETKPGVYTCGLMDIKVIDRVMPPPEEWKYYLDLWQHPWAVSRMEKVKPFSKEHYAAMRQVYELLATAGQKTLTVTLVDRAWNHQCRDAYGTMIGRVKRADGSWKFDYSLFDEYVAFGKSCGLGPHIACYTMCPWGNRVSWQDESGKTVWVEAPPGSKEFKDFWGDFLVDFSAHLKAKGWYEDTYIAMDERKPEDVKIIADFIQEKSPGMKIAMAGNCNPSKFKGIQIDNYSQYIEHLTPEFLAELDERRSKGFLTTYYVCCGPEFPNTFLTSKPYENFWVGVYPGIVRLDGFLRWAWNSWGEDPLLDASFRDWRAGDVFLVYPKGAASYRFLELRNGIVAAEKLRILRERGLFADEIAELEKKFNLKAAIGNRADFMKLKADVLKVVNKEK